jgi:tetratricopeptide (TPR) repeat protein
MSVILDALKKAQNERKKATKTLPYNPGKNLQKPRLLIYIVASLVFCVLIVFFLLSPEPKKPLKPVMMETKIVHPPSSFTPEKASSVIQPVAPEKAFEAQQSNKQGVAKHYGNPVEQQKKIAEPPRKRESDIKKSPVTESIRNIEQQDGPKVLITSIDHEKIVLKFNEAIKETAKGNISVAKHLYQSILSEQPSNIEALNNLGVIAIKEGDTKEALFYFNKVLQYNKNYGKAYNNIGIIMLRDGQKRLAEEYFRKSIELEKDVINPSLNLAALLRAEKRYEEAGRLLEGFINTNTKNRSLYLSFALIKDDMGQYEEAIKYYRLYLRETGGTSERNEVIERIRTLENSRSSKNH